MKVEPTALKDCYIIKPTIFEDSRGYFFESFNKKRFLELTGLDINFVQDNQSKSDRGVIRGLHYQKGIHAQAKLVRVIRGSVLDVAIDIRKYSPTFGQHFSIILSENNRLQLFIPRGFAHGFAVLENDTIFTYKCDNYYNKRSESGVIYNDPDLKIDWLLNHEDIILSKKDQFLPSFCEI